MCNIILPVHDVEEEHDRNVMALCNVFGNSVHGMYCPVRYVGEHVQYGMPAEKTSIWEYCAVNPGGRIIPPPFETGIVRNSGGATFWDTKVATCSVIGSSIWSCRTSRSALVTTTYSISLSRDLVPDTLEIAHIHPFFQYNRFVQKKKCLAQDIPPPDSCPYFFLRRGFSSSLLDDDQ